MNKPERPPLAPRQIVPASKLSARVAGVLKATGRDFVSRPVDRLELTYEGVKGDFHAGLTRRSGSREPWYARGTEMRNERQLSILSVEELAAIAEAMGLNRIEPGWIGANIVLEGVEAMTFLPPRTLLMFEGGVTLRVDGANGPCRIAGGSIARHLGARRTGGGLDRQDAAEFDWTKTDLAFAFVEAARMKRGLVAWVERGGAIEPGEDVTVRVWEQWIY
ncbi:MAG: molybdenum cofactor sulfurase [Alphaproteobacteria bacterium]|nr:MAG: molybdenum cofactor sulfurase [Alphaproteobacteria bacterium]